MPDGQQESQSARPIESFTLPLVEIPGASLVRSVLLRIGLSVSGWPAICAASVVGGVLPPVIALVTNQGVRVSGSLTVLLVVPLLCSFAVQGRVLAGASLLAATFAAHCAFCIAVSCFMPEIAAATFDGGQAYLEHSLAWIQTGTKPEFEYQGWLSAQILQAVGVAGLGLTSFGVLPVYQGVYECDLMNFYVGRLLSQSTAPMVTLSLGWHPWSICRGIGLLLLLHEAVAIAVAVFIGRIAPAPRGALLRLSIACCFLAADVVLKALAMPLVQRCLQESTAAS